MGSLLTDVNAWVTALLLAILMFGGWAAGWRRGRALKADASKAAPSKFNDAILTLLGLLLAFTFSMSLIKHEHRRQMAINDANAIENFVNCGGGAYLSIGTPLDWPSRPAVADAAFYPRTDAVVAKLDRETPTWMWPTWFWVKRFKAWPATVESLAPAFDFNRAPFFQSFVEVRVQPSTNSVRLIPHGVDGPLRWRDFQSFGNPRPPDQSEEGVVEFMVPMKEKQP